MVLFLLHANRAGVPAVLEVVPRSTFTLFFEMDIGLHGCKGVQPGAPVIVPKGALFMRGLCISSSFCKRTICA